MPRLHTLSNGFINWNWSSKEIELFIRAFDDPHEGASTFSDNQTFRLKKCSILKGNQFFHPFQAGLVFRKKSGAIYVAAGNKGLEIKETFDEKGNEVSSQIKLGQRFSTPNENLEKAKIYKFF